MGGLTAMELNEMIQLHAYITAASSQAATKCSVSEFLSCIIPEIRQECLFEASAVTNLKTNQTLVLKKIGLRLGLSDKRNETPVYRTRQYTGSKKVRSVLRKSRITTRFHKTALGCHGACLRKPRASDATALSLPGQGLRPCSLVNRPLYGPNKQKCRK
jgi:hypothetical protein